jgi:methylenetetrahydrofolate reductase (NADPH)
MKIIDKLKRGQPCFSFEFFPPKSEEGKTRLFQSIAELRPFAPAYVSVTYGALGSTQNVTVDLVRKIQFEIGIDAMAHLTCVGATQQQLQDVLTQLKQAGIENVLALRGDAPVGQEEFVATKGGFAYASELVGFAKSRFDFCLAGACYPETHTEAESPDADLQHLKEKVDRGTDFLISQLFFNNEDYFTFLSRAAKIGIDVPVIAGIMPVTNVAQVKRFTKMCGAKLPSSLLKRLEQHEDDRAAVRAIGVEHATAQCEELLKNGVPGLHFYTLNRSLATREILESLGHHAGAQNRA